MIQENNQLKTIIANLYTEAKAKIEAGNQQIQLGNAKIAEVQQDATDFAQVIAGQMQGGQQNVMPQVQNRGNGQAG